MALCIFNLNGNMNEFTWLSGNRPFRLPFVRLRLKIGSPTSNMSVRLRFICTNELFKNPCRTSLNHRLRSLCLLVTRAAYTKGGATFH